jgi:hypothetical protein
MSAFEMWFQINFKDQPTQGAEYLMTCVVHGSSDSVAWDYIKETKDTAYTKETFIKAAKLILEKE